MKIPKTTTDKPYIEFRFNKRGKMTLTTTSNWWGGIGSGFYGGDETRGNTCLPKDLDRYIVAFKRRWIREIEKKIALLQRELQEISGSTYKIREL